MNSRKAISVGRYEATLEKIKTVQPLVIGPNVFQLEPQPLSPAMVEKAKNELREIPEIVDQAFAEIRDYVKGIYACII